MTQTIVPHGGDLGCNSHSASAYDDESPHDYILSHQSSKTFWIEETLLQKPTRSWTRTEAMCLTTANTMRPGHTIFASNSSNY